MLRTEPFRREALQRLAAVALLAVTLSMGVSQAQAQGAGQANPSSQVSQGNQISRDPLVEARELHAWIGRLQEASRGRNYAGTFTLSSPVGSSTSRITHMCSGSDVYEQLDAMDGIRRTQLRHNSMVQTLYPEQKVATVEVRDTLNVFPQLVKIDGVKLSEFYEFRYVGEDRVAGHVSRVAHLKARDGLRFGLRVWTEEKTGLLLKSQLLGGSGEVLEQVAFSEVALNLPSQPERIKLAMKRLDGYRLEALASQKIDAKSEGWRMAVKIAGYKELACYKRTLRSDPLLEPRADSAARSVMQWVFSDGLNNVSMFVEPFVKELHGREAIMNVGATFSLTQRKGDWWVTVLGEVPPAALQAFVQSLQRVDAK